MSPPLAEQPGRFIRLADRVSYGMGTPLNIGIWLLVVFGWIAIFALHIVDANAQILPSWFIGPAFNFPLNSVTTLAQLYIGFLVAAAANRAERNHRHQLADMHEILWAMQAHQQADLTPDMKRPEPG